MLCLGIESSCDETGLALVRDGRLIAEKLASQVDVHAVFGGVVPEIASREHLRVLPVLFRELLKEQSLTVADIDVVAVARGPGLQGCLLMGLNFAKGLAFSSGATLVGVNHLWAHLTAAGLDQELQFPSLGVLVSGGHTHIYFIESPTMFTLLGRTLDDAAGEAFDKTAKSMNLPYPGGKLVDDLGKLGKVDKKMFPVPYIKNDNLDFSFSGLKTAVVTYVNAHPELRLDAMGLPDPATESAEITSARNNMLASFNYVVGRKLEVKVERALKRNRGVKSLIVAGGVAANSVVRSVMAGVADRFAIPLVLPSMHLCTDNGAMIAYAGYLMAESGYRHGLDLEAIPRGRVVPSDWICD
ncbi:tRNA (adenosine(37)-N6)-threonylcarbamoyltransferase complex transferase subunit TsaD [Maridesulfovibrio hydrothermalis]|uniref:tRNA N6-adenosine threonylcarbamoyltransferase n=1 Tax=Maridesulfovibrio hydrothermalis AM13 = DSM 14728 TaxID=1121451 RepID=L0RC90_9BACT|nr:tRNA (adenosine(37)-N6)-threonylcarbamoyltransferase complex transferase subunit TsaD [Maridesulfovibrio hydrothermalis]CCO24393.1 putative tRNA threonylcarbamoyladenosine biosynthesis protein Gcp [Maridesulfovibrio hydrothermalis AM13 = DSM 14728]